MKVSELFESSEEKSVHARVYRAVTAFALGRIKLDPETRAAAKYESENDRFFSSSIDEVTRTVEKYINDPDDSRLDYVFDAFVDCVEQISEKVVDYYSRAWNHAPGFKKPAGLTYPSVENLRDAEMMKVLHAAVPEFKAAHAEHQTINKTEKKAGLKANTAKVTPEFLQKMATLLSKKWPLAFTEKHMISMQKKPTYWTDWFSLDVIKAFKTPADVQRALKTDKARVEWVLDSIKGIPKDYHLMTHVIQTPALLKKLVPLIPQLKGSMKLSELKEAKKPDVKIEKSKDGERSFVYYRGKLLAVISKDDDGDWYAEARTDRGDDQSEDTYEKALDKFCQSADIPYKDV